MGVSDLCFSVSSFLFSGWSGSSCLCFLDMDLFRLLLPGSSLWLLLVLLRLKESERTSST